MNILSSVIRKILKNPKLSSRLDDIRIIEIWDEIIGKNLQKYVGKGFKEPEPSKSIEKVSKDTQKTIKDFQKFPQKPEKTSNERTTIRKNNERTTNVKTHIKIT